MKYMCLIYENPGTREVFFSDEKLRDSVGIRPPKSLALGAP